ncbi:MAG: DUF1828 domain-containing protein [Ignavibacteriales bacterium]|nr:DUF1828 domain-containing protein [Ignavibacteriales bacterium]
MDFLDSIREGFNNRVDFKEKRPGVWSVRAPIYHEDGDMIDVFVERTNGDDTVRLRDAGLTLMRLSYDYDLNTDNKRKIFQEIILKNGVEEEDDEIFIDAKTENVFPAMMQFAQAVAKVGSMRYFGREVVRSLFYEQLDEIVAKSVKNVPYQKNVAPVPERPELEVDYRFEVNSKPIFLMAVRGSNKAKQAAINFLEFRQLKLPYRAFVAHENLGDLPKNDITIVTRAADKQFTDLDNFRTDFPRALEAELAN